MQENCRSDNPARGIVLPAAERRKIDLDADRYAAFGRALAAAEARGKRWQAVAPPRSGRLAYDRSLGRAEEHHPRLPALARPRAQSGREHLAVPAPELASVMGPSVSIPNLAAGYLLPSVVGALAAT